MIHIQGKTFTAENMIKKILLDTNILIYLSDPTSKYYIENPDKLFGVNLLFISDRSLLEFYRVFTGYLNYSIEDTLQIIQFYQNSNKYSILYSNQEINFQTFELAEIYKAKSGKIFDLDILATAMINKIDIIYTKNIKDFPNNNAVKIADPTI